MPAQPQALPTKQGIQETPGGIAGAASGTVTKAHPNDVVKSPFRFLPFIFGALLLIGGLWFVLTKLLGIGLPGSSNTSTDSTTQTGGTSSTAPASKQVTLTWWGLWENSPALQSILTDFQTANPGVTVNYVQQSPTEYRERLADALSKGTGPDLFRFHNSWTPMLKAQMSTLPSTIMTQADYSATFYPVASKDLITTDGIVGIPLMYDSIALYYNKTIFTTAGKEPPKTWNDLDTLVDPKAGLTVRDAGGKIQRAGIALGTTGNVDHWPEIMTLLLLQNGADPSDLSSPLAAQAFKYYTDFSSVKHVWDDTLPASTYAFATEKTAMMIAPSWRAFDIKSINPNLDFGIAPIPQLPGTNVSVATYWAEGVSKTSKQQQLAWKLLQYMSKKEVLQKFYSDAASKTPRLFGEIYPRQDMASLLATDPYAGAFISDAPKATSWFMNARTFDNGINDKIIKYVGDAINVMNTANGANSDAALGTANLGVRQVLQQYGIPVSQTSAAATAPTSGIGSTP
ncbi:MAG TPA: extracellular solute-binding protein [Candidatus Saccharimonadia bacterium]|nr:extracellular solute-binding protein [Candidatus Saccharimonadia bacterium]